MFSRKGQNVAEYSVLVALVIFATVAMLVYFKRGIQGKIADAVDHAPDVDIREYDGTFLAKVDYKTAQFEPSYFSSAGEVESARGLTENITVNGETDRNIVGEVTTKLKGAYEQTKWSGVVGAR